MVSQIKSFDIMEVASGDTAILTCNSNDYDHNFAFWLINDKNLIIGPGNENYDQRKYKYDVLSGRLYINRVSSSEAGSYKCISKTLDGMKFIAAQVDMLVKGWSFTDAVKIIAIILSLVVIITCAVIYFRLRKEWSKYDGKKIVPVDEVEEEDGDEIYNRTTTAISQTLPGPSRNQSSDHLLYGVDNQGLDTDFNSVFENIQIKSPHASSLI